MALDYWMTGGCLEYATALKRTMGKGAVLVDVVEPFGDGVLLHPGLPHHVMVKKGDRYYDATGSYSASEVVSIWNERGRRHDMRIEPHDAVRARETRLSKRPERVQMAAAEIASAAAKRR